MHLSIGILKKIKKVFLSVFSALCIDSRRLGSDDVYEEPKRRKIYVKLLSYAAVTDGMNEGKTSL